MLELFQETCILSMSFGFKLLNCDAFG